MPHSGKVTRSAVLTSTEKARSTKATTEETHAVVRIEWEIRGESGTRAPHWFEFQGASSQGLR